MAEPDTTHATRERRLVEEAQRELCAAFPWLSADRVGALVEDLWAEYDGARIRDYIPVLVRKQARHVLRDGHHAGSTDPTAAGPHGEREGAPSGLPSRGPEAAHPGGDTGFAPVRKRPLRGSAIGDLAL